MDHSIAELYNQDLISREDALIQCVNPDVLLKYMKAWRNIKVTGQDF